MIDKINTLESLIVPQEQRVSSIEATSGVLTSEIQTLYKISSELKKDLEGVQYVLVQLIDLESRVEESSQFYELLAAENKDIRTEISHLKSEIAALKNHFHQFEEAHKLTSVNDVSLEQQQINTNIIIRGVDIDDNSDKDLLQDTFNQIRSHFGVSEVGDFEAADIGILP